MTLQIAVAPIDTVIVTEDRAHVQRRGTVEIPSGITRVRIDDVAPVIADKTLRVRAGSGVAVGEARVVRRKVATEPAEAHAELVAELEKHMASTELGAANVKRLQAAITLLHEAQRRVLEELAEDAARGIADAPTAERAVRVFEESERAAYADVLEAQRAQRELDKTIGRLRTRLTQAGHKEVRIIASIEMTLSATAAGKTELVVEYLVPGACWRPQHTAMLLRSAGADVADWLTVTTDACVWQNTGEDWTAATLKFSTERPSLGQKPPTLGDDEVKAQKRNEVIRVEHRDEAIQRTGLGGAPPPRVPGIDDGGEVRVLVAKAHASVPSDGRPYRVPTLSMETKAKPTLVAYPELAQAVLVRAEQTNAGATPLLAGPVDLVRESGFVGRTKIALIASGERFELGFGPDPHVRLRREVETVDEEAGLLPSSYVGRSHRVRVHLSNLDDRPRKIDVTERIPVSEIEKVEVHFDEKKTTPRATPDADGFVRWQVDLAARGRTTLELRYVIRRHKDVVGL
jgi:hypothetical protein